MNRRTFLKTLGLSPLVLPLLTNFSKSKQPNIIFIFSDDHAVNAISAYGSKINKTPAMDRIAAAGVVLDRCYCCNSICAPSRAAVLTGKHSHANGLMTNQNRFDPNQTTFPKLLQGAGYQTVMIGKWHLKTDPTGFDHWQVLTGQGHYYNPDFRTAAGTKRYPGYATDITTDLAIDWLKNDRDQNKPFLLMCQHKAPHRTWAPGPKHLTMYDDITIPEPQTLFDDYANRNSTLKDNEMMIAKHLMYEYDLKIAGSPKKDALGRAFRNPELARMSPAQRKLWDAAYEPKNKAFKDANLQGQELVRWMYQRYIKDYLRCVASVDDNIGRLLDYLDEENLTDDTLIIYSSDQGFYLGEHGWYDKRWMYEESFRMPFIARWPGVIPPGNRSMQLAQNIDFAPTFLAAAGVSIPTEMQGESLIPLLKGTYPPNWRSSLYYHYYEKGEHNVPRHYGVRTEHHKLIHYYDSDQWELFDLQQDPREMKSVYGEPSYQEIQTLMHNELKRLRKLYKVPVL